MTRFYVFVARWLSGAMLSLGLFLVTGSAAFAQPVPHAIAASGTEKEGAAGVGPASAVRERQAWQGRMTARKLLKEGCFVAAYPNEDWKEQPCTVAPSRRNVPVARSPNPKPLAGPGPAPQPPQQTGNGYDLTALSNGGPIIYAVGSFPQTLNVNSVQSVLPGKPTTIGTFSLQLNPEPVVTPACANAQDPGVCRGWEQFIFLTSTKHAYAYIEYWLMNYGPTCPGTGNVPAIPGTPANTTWISSSNGNDCVFDSPTVLIDPQPVTALGKMSLMALVDGQNNDTVFFVDANGDLHAAGLPGKIFQLADSWQQVEFNVFGFNDAEQAVFSPKAAIVVDLKVLDTKRSTPTVVTGGFTGETNNLTLVPPGCPYTNSPSGITFEEYNVNGVGPGIVSHTCPPAPKDCAALANALAAAQQQLAAAQNRQRNDPLCKGPGSLLCAKQVQTAQNLVTAAMKAYRTQCPLGGGGS